MKNNSLSRKFIFLTFISFSSIASLLYIMNSLNYVNMINNGYVHKNAVDFIISTEESSLDIELEKPYLLMQHNSENPMLRYVFINKSVKLPPIKYQKENISEEYVIKGSLSPVDDLSENMKRRIIGEFDTPKSYILNSHIWYISESLNINLENGKRFTLNVEDREAIKLIPEIFPDVNYKIIDAEESGTYILKSNILVEAFLIITIILVILVHTATLFYSIKNKKSFVQILYLSGGKSHVIFRKIFKKEFIVVLIVIVLESLLLIMINNFYSLWGNKWLYLSISYMLIFFIVYFLACLLLTKALIKKGVRSF